MLTQLRSWASSFTTKVVLAGLIPLVLVTGLVVVQARSSARDQDAQRAASKAAAASAALDQLFTEWRSEVLLGAHNKVLQDWYSHPEQRSQLQPLVNAELVRLHSLYPDLISEACFIDKGGPEMARMVHGAPAASADLSSDESKNPFFGPTFAAGVENVDQQAPYVSPDTNTWVIANATPVVVDGAPVGLWHFEASLDGVRTRLQRIVGRDTKIRVLAADGTVLIDSAHVVSHAPFVGGGAADPLSGVVGRSRTESTPYNQNRWTVQTAVPASSVFTGSRGGQLVSVLLLAIALLALVARRISGGLTRPVEGMTAAANALGDGDLTSRVQVDGESVVATMAGAINRAAECLDVAIGEIMTETSTLAAASVQLTAVSDSLADSANESSGTTNQLVGEVGVIRNVLGDLVTRAESMSSSMGAIVGSANDATAVVNSAARHANDAIAAVGRLEESSTRINDVVQIIESLASQTNLLALNATIEAARAGDAGKGFAVVAHEVKELAQNTSTATSTIASQIEAIQHDTVAVIGQIEAIASVIQQVQESQAVIVEAASGQSVETAAMSASAHEAGRVVVSMDSGLARFVGAVDATAVSAEQGRATSERLSSMASRLQSLTGQFRPTRT